MVWHDLPLGMHKRAGPAAEAARCANEQGKFWEYHDKIFANQQKLNDEDLKQYAVDLGLKTDQFNQCYDSGKYREAVQTDARKAAEMGITGTPGFLINGRFLSGAQPFEAFKAMIDEELSKG